MSGPTIDRANSSGDIWTPLVFRSAVTRRFGQPAFDLAATTESAFGDEWYTETDDSLEQEWSKLKGLLWLNCPYSNITPWTKKCMKESLLGAKILLLVPGSIGANWYWDWVEPYADVYSVGRMVFDNCFSKRGELVTTSYPKDLILARYHGGMQLPFRRPLRMQRWRWK